MSEIILDNVSKTFPVSGEILRNVTFHVRDGEFVSIFGPNGCGKSTLMNIIAGIDTASSGRVVAPLAKNKEIGFVFQDYRKSLFPWLSAKENIFFPLKLSGVSVAECEHRLNELMQKVPVSFNLSQRVFTLSGGQAQTVGLLRALIIKPKLLILDEPFSALDFSATLSLRETLSRISKELNLTTLLISHDLEDAILLGDRVVFLSKKPTVISEVLDVDFPKPRLNELVGEAGFAALMGSALKKVV